MRRERITLAAILILQIPLSYWLRFRAPFSASFRDAAGGALYVMLWIFAAALLFVRAAPWVLSAWVLAITCALEFLQQWHPPWLEAIRGTFAGRVVLGTTFGWDDFPPYFAGAFTAWLLLKAIRQLRHTGNPGDHY